MHAKAVEVVVVLALFLGSTALGMAVLKGQRSPDGLSSIRGPITFFSRPLMIAAGRGSFHPSIDTVPGLLPFLEHSTATFDPVSLPKDIPVCHDSAAEYHLYLGWTVAAIWRVFGISWLVLEPFLALALGLCTVFVYGLFRLGMNRWLSLAGTVLFATSPAVLGQVHEVRDFLKAPFLLGGLFAIGWIITRRAPVRFLWLIAALMGLIAGTGMGFRQDAIILVPVSLAGILVLSPGAVYRTTRRRAGAALVYLLAFLAAAAPMFTRMEGNAQPYHPLAQGYSMKHMDRCSLVPGVCEPLACSNDAFVFATVFFYARRATGDNHNYFGYGDPEDMQFTRDWVIRTGLQFPADTIARGYGAVLDVLSDADACMPTALNDKGWQALLAETHRRLAVFFRLAGVPIALLALLAAAAASPRIAVVLVALMLYFCGYVSLDNESRHTFHLAFVCFWASGFLVQQMIFALGHNLCGTAQWGSWLRRAGISFILAALVLWTPWQAARFWQQHNVNDVMRQYASAPRTEVPAKAEPMRDLTLFRLEANTSNAAILTRLGRIPLVADLLRGVPHSRWETSCSLYAVHLRVRQSGHRFLAKYWGNAGTGDSYTQVMRTAGTDKDDGETWFFFPVYEFADNAVFEGVAFLREDAGDFLGLYRVADGALPMLLPCVTLNEPGGRRHLTASMNVPYDPMRFFTPENGLPDIAEASQEAGRLGRLDTALFCLRVANALNPSIDVESKILGLCENASQTQEALRILKSKIESTGGDADSCARMAAFLKSRASELSAPSVWEEIVRDVPSQYVWQAYEGAVKEDDVEKHMYILRQLFRVAPNASACSAKLQCLLDGKAGQLESSGDLPGAVLACREAIPLNPMNNKPVLHLETVLSKRSLAERREIWEEVWKDNPNNPLVAALCGVACAADKDLAGAREAFDAALRFGGEDPNICGMAGDAYASLSAWSEAVTAYGRSQAFNPELYRQQLLLATAHRNEQEGDTVGVIEAYKKVIPANPANGEPCWRLNAVLSKENPAAVRTVWDALRREAPDNAFVAVLCGAARAADGDSAGACEALAAALRLGGEDWNICATAGDAYTRIGAWSDAVAAYERVLTFNPDLRRQHLLIATGCRNEQDGDIPGAIDAYQKAIQVNPANSEPYWRLDTACPKTDPEVAVGLWREIRESVPENAAVDALYGESLAAANSADQARTMLEAALRLGGNDSHVLVHVGNAYFSMADWPQAAACYDRALAANPGLEFLHPRLEEARRQGRN